MKLRWLILLAACLFGSSVQAQTLAWDPPTSGLVSLYTVKVDTEPSVWVTPPTTTWTIPTTLAVGTHALVVSACNDAGCTAAPALTYTVPGAPPPPPADPCALAVPRITPGEWTSRFKLGSYGRVNITDLDWTAEVGDRRIVWVETQLGSQPAARITNPDVLATLTSLTYRSAEKGTFNLVVRAGDSLGCVGATGAVRQVRVN